MREESLESESSENCSFNTEKKAQNNEKKIKRVISYQQMDEEEHNKSFDEEEPIIAKKETENADKNKGKGEDDDDEEEENGNGGESDGAKSNSEQINKFYQHQFEVSQIRLEEAKPFPLKLMSSKFLLKALQDCKAKVH